MALDIVWKNPRIKYQIRLFSLFAKQSTHIMLDIEGCCNYVYVVFHVDEFTIVHVIVKSTVFNRFMILSLRLSRLDSEAS